ncbi:hypothetical protein EN45_097900 [Penicillium chrysogenum]|jgi:hypothetical protein|uniref:Uncharacterized protein n=1 Tax=Penicillium chrysogenum TaxID=5076 RepID=A0A167R613_PENCH|nr:uncharacterized protein N7525_005460 [Penicillium rubens]KAJ5043872.1 hypothetical protein NUH16_000665 [Penicillium rubens]KAJ5840272.1 hypothetical protein N7525_005460 [Penicillium rubens]KZN85601.1 hypothetical protein EN45_097900 [Penicillium chrysogenum]
MAITNSIYLEAHVGSVDGISVIWGPNSADNLSSNAEDYNMRRSVLEDSTDNMGGSAPTRKLQDDGPLRSQPRSEYNLKYLEH